MQSPWRRFLGAGYRGAEIAVHPAESCCRDGLSLGAREVRIIPVGLPDPGVIAAGPTGGSGERFRVLYIGHLCPEKGLGLIPEIAARLNKKAKIDVIGEWKSPAYRREMESSLTQAGVRLHGGCRGADKWAYFQNADVLLFPSFQETQGLVAVEAMACGLPIVASDIEGIRDVVSDGGEGLLVESGNAGGFADAISSVCGDVAVWRRLSQAGRRRYEGSFTLDHYLDGMGQAFRDCMTMATVGSPGGHA